MCWYSGFDAPILRKFIGETNFNPIFSSKVTRVSCGIVGLTFDNTSLSAGEIRRLALMTSLLTTI